MDVGRFGIYLVGLVLVVAAVWLFFVETGISQWVPVTLLGAAILLVVGLGIMGASRTADEDEHVDHHHGAGHRD